MNAVEGLIAPLHVLATIALVFIAGRIEPIYGTGRLVHS